MTPQLKRAYNLGRVYAIKSAFGPPPNTWPMEGAKYGLLRGGGIGAGVGGIVGGLYGAATRDEEKESLSKAVATGALKGLGIGGVTGGLGAGAYYGYQGITGASEADSALATIAALTRERDTIMKDSPLLWPFHPRMSAIVNEAAAAGQRGVKAIPDFLLPRFQEQLDALKEQQASGG